jgi:uncharacterized repeat protein (TIGR01451 family)
MHASNNYGRRLIIGCLMVLLTSLSRSAAEPVVAAPGSFRVEKVATASGMMTISFDADGNLFVGRDENGSVTPWPVRMVTPAGVVSDFGSPIDDPDSVVVDIAGMLAPPGSVLVAGGIAGSTMQRITVVAADGMSVSTPFEGTPTLAWDNPGDMEFDNLGRLLIANFGSVGLPAPGPGTVSVFTNGAPVVLHDLGDARINSVVASPGGRIFASLFGSSTEIREIIENGATTDSPVVTNLSGALTYSADGFGDMTKPLFVGSGQTVRRINPETGEFEIFATGFVGISDIKFAANGCLYIADRNGGLIWRICNCEPSTMDLAAFKTDSPDPALTGSNLTYTVTVRKYCDAPATGVTLTDMLPPGVTFVSADSTQGVCTNIGSNVICDIGTMTNSQTALVTITVVPTVQGTITNTVTVAANETEVSDLNNTAQSVTTIAPGGVDLTAEAEATFGACTPDGSKLLCPVDGTLTLLNHNIPYVDSTFALTLTCKTTKVPPKCKLKGILMVSDFDLGDIPDHSVAFYLSEDDVLDVSDEFLRTLPLKKAFKAFLKGKSIKLSLKLPKGIDLTGQHLIVMVDPPDKKGFDDVEETDETNNTAVSDPLPSLP